MSKFVKVLGILFAVLLVATCEATALTKVKPPRSLDVGWRMSNLPAAKRKAYEEYEKLYDRFVRVATMSEQLYARTQKDALKKNIDDLNKLAKSPLWANLRSGEPFKVQSASKYLKSEINCRSKINDLYEDNKPTTTIAVNTVSEVNTYSDVETNSGMESKQYSTHLEQQYYTWLKAAQQNAHRIVTLHAEEERRTGVKREISGKERREMLREFDFADQFLREAKANDEEWSRNL